MCNAVGEANQVITNGRTGFVVQPGDHTAMANALEALVLSEDLRARLGHAAQQDIVSRFSTDRMVAAYAALYKRVLRRDDRGHATAQV